MFDMLQATCSSCEKGAWHFVRPDFGVFEPDFAETDMLLGWRGRLDMFTLLRGRDTGLGHHTQVGMLTCVHARVSLGHHNLT